MALIKTIIDGKEVEVERDRWALDVAREGLGLSLRGVQRCLSVAATLAALDGRPGVGPGEVAEALEFRRGVLSLTPDP